MIPEIGESATIIVNNGMYWDSCKKYIPKYETLNVLVVSIGPRKSVVVDNENDDDNTLFSVPNDELMDWAEAIPKIKQMNKKL